MQSHSNSSLLFVGFPVSRTTELIWSINIKNKYCSSARPVASSSGSTCAIIWIVGCGDTFVYGVFSTAIMNEWARRRDGSEEGERGDSIWLRFINKGVSCGCLGAYAVNRVYRRTVFYIWIKMAAGIRVGRTGEQIKWYNVRYFEVRR